MENNNSPPISEVVSIPISALKPFPNHPFAVREDPALTDTVESVKNFGVLVPAIVRNKGNGEFEILSGHRRKYACELAGIAELPCIIKDMDDDSAIIFMVDSNLQREAILPSERAQAYKMRLEAIKRKAGRPNKDTQKNAPNFSAHFRSDDEVGNIEGISGDTVRNYIALTNLTPELMQLVDDKKIALSPAYNLAALSTDEQTLLLETIKSEQATPSLSQAQRIRKLSQSGELNENNMLEIMSEQKRSEKEDIVLSGERLRKYFPKSYTPARIEETIYKLLDSWLKKRQRDNCR